MKVDWDRWDVSGKDYLYTTDTGELIILSKQDLINIKRFLDQVDGFSVEYQGLLKQRGARV